MVLEGLSSRMNRNSTDDNPTAKIATPNVRMYGSVHSTGEAHVTVERLHADNEGVPISVAGSIHGTGSQGVEVNNHLELGVELPEPADETYGFTSLVEDELSMHGSVHSSGSVVTDIGNLVIIPDGRPDVMVALDKAGYDVYEEVTLEGSVHGTGRLEVTVEDLYVYPDKQ